MPSLTPIFPFDPALIHAARMTPHTPSPAIDGIPVPIVLGGRQRSDSPFLDLLPLGEAGEDGAMVDDDDPDDDQTDDEGADADGLEPVGMVPLVPTVPIVLGATGDVLPETPFDREAVARARARATRPVERVEGSVTSDDGVVDHVCDVTEWLAGATVRELRDLARAGWAGDEAADVAAVLAEDDPEVADVLRHARRTDTEVVVEIDGRAAMAWLARHRPSVAEAIDDALAEDEAEGDED